MVRGTGFEPVTPTVSVWCSTTELTALDEPSLPFWMAAAGALHKAIASVRNWKNFLHALTSFTRVQEEFPFAHWTNMNTHVFWHR